VRDSPASASSAATHAFPIAFADDHARIADNVRNLAAVRGDHGHAQANASVSMRPNCSRHFAVVWLGRAQHVHRIQIRRTSWCATTSARERDRRTGGSTNERPTRAVPIRMKSARHGVFNRSSTSSEP